MGGIGGITFNWDIIAPGSAVVALGFLCYIAGRMHQFYRATADRDHAYREGYNLATRSLFSLATRASKGIEAPPMLEARKPLPAPKPIKATATVNRGRHAAEGQSTMQQTKVMNAWEKYHAA